ncbi:PRD domain-containing protein [Aeromonas sobria]|nr:PRD domain-containing protein [Aeromonas sobria]
MIERLQLLQSADVISTDALKACLVVMDDLRDHFSVSDDNEQYQMMIVHLARAFDRIKSGAPIEQGMDPSLFDEVQEDPFFHEMDVLNRRMLDAIDLAEAPDSEKSFMLSNLLSLHYSCQEHI